MVLIYGFGIQNSRTYIYQNQIVAWENVISQLHEGIKKLIKTIPFSNTSFFDKANLKHAYIQMHDRYSLSSPNHGTKFFNSRSLSHNLFTLSHAPNLHDWLPLSLSLISTKVSFFAIQEINNNGAQELTLSNLNDLVISFKKSQLVKVGTLIVFKGEGWGWMGKR